MFIFLNSQPNDQPIYINNELLSALIQIIGFLIANYFLFYKKNNKIDKEKAYEPIISKIFKPFHFSLERHLFHKPKTSIEISDLKTKLKLTKKELSQSNLSKLSILKLFIKTYKLNNSLNRSVDLTHLYKTLTNLKNTIKQNKLEFYLNDFFLYYLEKILAIIENFNSKTPSSEDLKDLHYYFKKFSSQYLQELQQSRKSVGLKKRTLGYRQNFGLYANKPLFYFKIYWIPIVAYVILIIINFKFLKK